MTELSRAIDGLPHSRLREVEVDLLFWYPVQNLFHGYFSSTAEIKRSPSESVLVALNQIISTSLNTEYFSLADVSDSVKFLTWRVVSNECNPNRIRSRRRQATQLLATQSANGDPVRNLAETFRAKADSSIFRQLRVSVEPQAKNSKHGKR